MNAKPISAKTPLYSTETAPAPGRSVEDAFDAVIARYFECLQALSWARNAELAAQIDSLEAELSLEVELADLAGRVTWRWAACGLIRGRPELATALSEWHPEKRLHHGGERETTVPACDFVIASAHDLCGDGADALLRRVAPRGTLHVSLPSRVSGVTSPILRTIFAELARHRDCEPEALTARITSAGLSRTAQFDLAVSVDGPRERLLFARRVLAESILSARDGASIDHDELVYELAAWTVSDVDAITASFPRLLFARDPETHA